MANEVAYRRSRSLLPVSTTGMSVCAERKRLRARPLNLAIEVLGHENNRDTSRLVTTHSAVSPPQSRKRRDSRCKEQSASIQVTQLSARVASQYILRLANQDPMV
jgi:hypothetical protein